jgi:hypothetical protein
MIAWTFTDGIAPETYQVPINPNQGGSPQLQKTLTTTTSSNGTEIVFEGRDRPRTFSIRGVILEESHLTAFENWYNKNYQVQVTDDLSRTYWIYITRFTAERAPSRNHNFRHKFTMEYTEVDWP